MPRQLVDPGRTLAVVTNDFDFLVGTYTVHNCRRRGDEWEEFAAENTGTRYLDGQAVVDEYRGTLPDGRGLVLVDMHVFDPDTQEWTNTIHVAGSAPDWAPMRGRFRDGVGVFHQTVTSADGTTQHIRHTWDRITPTSARFRQHLSADGETWTTDWVMTLTRPRTSPLTPDPRCPDPAPA
jgi:hypothetical protein